ncbi:hypothetical protein MTO96_030679 [Rhipicephalus appendiculatus]
MVRADQSPTNNLPGTCVLVSSHYMKVPEHILWRLHGVQRAFESRQVRRRVLDTGCFGLHTIQLPRSKTTGKLRQSDASRYGEGCIPSRFDKCKMHRQPTLLRCPPRPIAASP